MPRRTVREDTRGQYVSAGGERYRPWPAGVPFPDDLYSANRIAISDSAEQRQGLEVLVTPTGFPGTATVRSTDYRPKLAPRELWISDSYINALREKGEGQ